MSGKVGLDYVHATLLQGAAALPCKSGVIGSAGGARDTEFYGFIILKNAGPATLTVTGMADNTGTQQPVVFSGSTTQDVTVLFQAPIVNEVAPFTFQPSIAATVLLLTRAYTGA